MFTPHTSLPYTKMGFTNDWNITTCENQNITQICNMSVTVTHVLLVDLSGRNSTCGKEPLVPRRVIGTRVTKRIRYVHTIRESCKVCASRDTLAATYLLLTVALHCYEQGWGQFNSGIGIAAQFQFRNWNWNWNWWNWKWNWNWKPWNWNWKPELNFLQLLPQQLLVSQPFPNFSFNRGSHNLSCDWLYTQQVLLGHCPPGVWSQKTQGQGILFPLSRQRWEESKMGTINISLTAWYKPNYYHC